MGSLTAWVIGPRKEVMIACDWTKVRQWPVLSASVIYRGRALPILWAVLDLPQLHKSLNSFEHGFFTLLAQLLPRTVKAIVLLDRGFKPSRVDSPSGATRVFVCDPLGRQHFDGTSSLSRIHADCDSNSLCPPRLMRLL